MHLKFFPQLPDNAYASHSKCPLQFRNFAALMQANVESTEVQSPRLSTCTIQGCLVLIWNNTGCENANMHHGTVLITLNLVHKQYVCYICHMTQNLQYYKVQQSQRTHKNNIRFCRFAWTTSAKSLSKICYIAGIHSTGHAGQMWPVRRLKMARKQFTECSQCFSR